MTKREQILEALTYALQNINSQIRVSLLTAIADYLPQDLNEEVQDLKEEVLRQALVAIEYMPHPSRLNALKSLAHKLPPDLLPKAFAIGKAIKSSGLARAQAIETLAPLLPTDLLLEALDVARKPNLNTEYTTALALSALVDKLPEELQTEVALEALAAAESLPPEEEGRGYVYRSGALIAVVDVLPEPLRSQVLQKALDSARGIDEHWCRTNSLANLAPKLPEALQVEVLQEALDAARDEVESEEGWATAWAISNLIPKLPPDLLPEALTIARDIPLEGDRTMGLIAITARLPELLPETFALVKKTHQSGLTHQIGSTYDRVKALTDIAPHLSAELLPEAFDIAKDIQSKRDRTKLLIALASPISKMPKDELLSLWQTMKHWLSQQSRREFAHHTLALAAVIHAVGGQDAVVETLIEIQNAERWQQ